MTKHQQQLPPIPRASWIVRILVPAGDVWRAEKRIRALDALPATGDPITLEGGSSARVAGVCSPAMSGVHADIYAAPIAADDGEGESGSHNDSRIEGSAPTRRVPERELLSFTAEVLRRAGLRDGDAETTAAVLVASDVRGISSHGVARLAYYLAMIEAGTIDPRSEPAIVRESATTAVLDARNGLGQPVGVRAMTLAMAKAAAHDIGVVAARHSNHYGIAGYYAMLALERDMIGLSLTNTHPAVAPTGGRQPAIGTNPIAIAIPTAGPIPFVLDMATSVAPRGRLEVAERRGEAIPSGWALDAEGRETTNAVAGLAGALLPLGGPVVTSGYKGYGLAMAVEALSAVLPGALYGPLVAPMWDVAGPSDLGQFFMALNVAAFDDPRDFKARMHDLLRRIKEAPRAEGVAEILVAGEKEQRAAELSRRHGVPLDASVVAALAHIAERYNLEAPFLTGSS